MLEVITNFKCYRKASWMKYSLMTNYKELVPSSFTHILFNVYNSQYSFP